MTIRQIAEVAGCHIDTVRGIARPMFPEVKASKRGCAIEYNKEQSIAIMEKLPKRNMVSTNPSDNQVVPLEESSTTLMLNMVKSLIVQQSEERKQNQIFMTTLLQEVKSISKGSVQIEQPKQDYYSLLAFCSIKNIKVSHSESIMHGKHLKKICSEKNAELRTIPDERWGKVNSYPVEILEEYFTI